MVIGTVNFLTKDRHYIETVKQYDYALFSNHSSEIDKFLRITYL
jgi:hypothetical protein